MYCMVSIRPKGLTPVPAFQLLRASTGQADSFLHRPQLFHLLHQCPSRLALFQENEAIDCDPGSHSMWNTRGWVLPCVLIQEVQTTQQGCLVPVVMRKKVNLGGSVMWSEQLLEEKKQVTHTPTSEAFLVGGSPECFLQGKNPHKLQSEKGVELTPDLRSLNGLVISRHSCPRQPKTSLRN